MFGSTGSTKTIYDVMEMLNEQPEMIKIISDNKIENGKRDDEDDS